MTTAAPPSAAPPPPRRPLGEAAFDLVVWGGLALALLLSVRAVDLPALGDLVTYSGNMRQYIGDFAQPDFGRWRTYVAAMVLTIQIALWGTTIAVVLAVPLGLLAARNIAPVWIVQPVRRGLDLLRAAPDLVLGALFIVAVGPGPLAGVLAIGLNTAGVLGKLFSEAVEAMDPRPVEGVRATGARGLHEIVWGVIPQVAPLWTSYALYRFESNARAATVLGLIGAGGIGQLLFDNMNSFAYGRVAAIALVIVAAVSLIDLLSQVIRKRLV